MQAEVKIKASMQISKSDVEVQARKQGQKAGIAFQQGAKRTGILDLLKSNRGSLNSIKGILTGGGLKNLLNPSMLMGAIATPIGAVLAAISGTFLAIKMKFESQAKQLDRQIGISQQRISDKETSLNESDEKNLRNIAIMEKLRQYVNKYKGGQILSDGQVKNAIDLVKQLDKSYKGLGITVNTLTRSVDNFNEAILEMVKSSALTNKIKQLDQISDEYNSLMNFSSRKAANSFNLTQLQALQNNSTTLRDLFNELDDIFAYTSAVAKNWWDIDSPFFIGDPEIVENAIKNRPKEKNGIRDLTNATRNQLEIEEAINNERGSLGYALAKLIHQPGLRLSNFIQPYFDRILNDIGLKDYEDTPEGKADKLFSGLNQLDSDEKIAKMKELIEHFAQVRDFANTQQKAESIQNIINNLRKMIKLEQQRNNLIKERANLQQNLLKQKIQQANIVRSNQWNKQQNLDKQIFDFKQQDRFRNLDTDQEKRKFYQEKLSNFQTSRKNLSDVNDEIASKRYGNQSQKLQNSIRIQELEDFSAFIGRLKEKQDTYSGLKGKSGFEFYESILKIMNKEIPNVEKNYKNQGAGFKKEDRKQWETWLIESKQRRNVLESLLKNIDPNLSNEEKGAIVEQRLKRQIDSRNNKVFKFDDERAKDSAQIAKNETQIKRIMLQELKIKRQIDELDKRKQEYLGKITRNNVWEKEKFMAQLKGDWDSYLGDEVQVQDINNKLGLTMDQKIDWMQSKKKERKLNVFKMLYGKAESMYDSYLPNTYQGDVERTIRQIEKANKITLQPDMVDKVRQLLRIKWDKQETDGYINNISRNLNIKTNQMTARGGFAGGVYVPTQDFARITANNSQLQSNLLRQINGYVANLQQSVNQIP